MSPSSSYGPTDFCPSKPGQVGMNENVPQSGAQLEIKAWALKGSITLYPAIKTNMMKERALFFLTTFQNNKK